jgi:hypothetical protein
MLPSSLYVVFGFAAGAVLLSWAYFRRYQLARPPIGVFGLGDVLVMIGAIILIPFLYLALPLWFVTGLLALAMLSLLYFTLEPVLRSSWASWIVVLLLLGVAIWSNLWLGASSPLFLLVNNAVLALAVVGATNLWAQGGMKARDMAVLAGVLAIYDLTATTLLPLMGDMFVRLASIPFAPLVSWGAGSQQLSIGLGDLLLLSAFALVMRKAFGLSAGIVAMTLNLVTLALLLTLLVLGNVLVIVPVMSILGPLMVAQYVYWFRQRRLERTTQEYLQAEPMSKQSLASGKSS